QSFIQLTISLTSLIFIPSFQYPGDHRYLHSFPTRRFSDLDAPIASAFRSGAKEGDMRQVLDAEGVAAHDDVLAWWGWHDGAEARSEEHTSELQSRGHLVCRLLLEKKSTTDAYTSQARFYLY